VAECTARRWQPDEAVAHPGQRAADAVFRGCPFSRADVMSVPRRVEWKGAVEEQALFDVPRPELPEPSQLLRAERELERQEPSVRAPVPRPVFRQPARRLDGDV